VGFPENLSENITVVMIAAKNMVRHVESLDNLTKIMISFQISRIAYIACNDTQFSICVQLFDA
jgi:hypothetical protein